MLLAPVSLIFFGHGALPFSWPHCGGTPNFSSMHTSVCNFGAPSFWLPQAALEGFLTILLRCLLGMLLWEIFRQLSTWMATDGQETLKRLQEGGALQKWSARDLTSHPVQGNSRHPVASVSGNNIMPLLPSPFSKANKV